MPRRARSPQSDCYVHVINRSAHNLPLFERSKDYRDFLRILREGLNRYPVRLVSYCLMSNHWHLVAAPVGSAVLSRLVHWVTTTHAAQGRCKSHPVEGLGQLLHVIRVWSARRSPRTWSAARRTGPGGAWPTGSDRRLRCHSRARRFSRRARGSTL
jgi:putative transposase